MFIVTLVGLGLTLGTVMGHYLILYRVARFLDAADLDGKMRIVISVSALLTALLATVLIYAVAYYVFHVGGGYGALDGKLSGGLVDFFYFSIMSFTTLGVGDVYPTGALRILSGLQALNGFVLLGLSGSFTFLIMRNTWKD